MLELCVVPATQRKQAAPVHSMQVGTLNGVGAVEAVKTDPQKPLLLLLHLALQLQLLIVDGDVELLWLAGPILAALPPLAAKNKIL